ncbi:farnesyltransferase [Neocallimastix lanati (nom. inval.)]|jgi:protein farnesyltransferase/geranylgeranyltransferase type-1 subunit alpha|uniref:Protein farnesyltransferase/geranylgeranyltransferase type-1 subunit alpha n=2 Tax=Neocallimastix californiae TaxID=1754190 RepID=A0A1Y2DTL7_9FUNG|nr:farnesyltransferase [Neocallimastix sp. JGI-2020a]ORY61975.1 farnesyltransferase [Neocallimastix californiae]|eukprot:ORY61975.1 farnesyltransferase [Neocallimastix californiae]
METILNSEWSDIERTEQDEGPFEVMPIAYSIEYKEKMDILRTLMKNNEKSERALKLTEEIISLSPSNYVIWKYRQEILKELKIDLRKELVIFEEYAEENPKCYQLWHHRQFIIEILNDPMDELQFIYDMLINDSKNYHAWNYREWIVVHFNLWKDELMFCDTMLRDDDRNNAAWNYRYFIITNSPNCDINELLKSEIDLSKQKINFDPTNVSPWMYLKGIIETSKYELADFADELLPFCEELQKREPFKYALEFQLRVNESILNRLKDDKEKEQQKDICRVLCSKLEECDEIKKKYWKFIRESY